MNYNSPGVYIQDVKSNSQSITQASSSIGALIGATRSGIDGEAQLVTSFTEFINLYANGLDTPFMSNSALTYAVHGFFTNGGQQLYVGRVVSDSAKKATKTTESGITVTAKHKGTYGNDIKVKVVKSADYTDSNLIYDVTVLVGNSDSATVTEVTVDTMATKVLENTKIKNWLEEFTLGEGYTIKEEEIVLEGGADGVDDLTDNDFTEALAMFDFIDDVTFIAIPGQTSKVVNDALLAYCDNHTLFPILDMPMGSTVKATKEYRKTVSAKGGALVYPWGKMNDPLTNTLKLVPACGHTMGVYARTVEEVGIHKAPAGVNAVVRGFVEMETKLSQNDIAQLNPVGVVCITSRPNAGIVIWGARGLNNDTTMKYVSDVLINYHIKKSLYNGTQYAVFEPNDESLWSNVQATCKAFLESLRLQGTLKGTSDEAYFVTVDSSNNTEESINNGILNIEIGYAPVKPAEFVVIKLAHSIEATA